VAAVAADTERQAQEAVDLITVHYEELPAVLDADQALDSNAPLVHPDLHAYRRGRHEIVPHSNINSVTRYSHGDVEEGFRQADLVFENEFSVHAVSHVTLEPHTAVAVYSHVDQGYTLWVSTDRPFQLRDELATALGIPRRQVRIVVGYVGGSFGGKGTLIAEAVAVALARQIPGRPVRIAFSREEDLVASRVRMPARIRPKTGVSRDGNSRLGRPIRVGQVPMPRTGESRSVGPGGVRPYRIPHVEYRSHGVHQHLSYKSYRGTAPPRRPGRESQMDIIAHGLGLDPLMLRRANGYREGDKWINGQVMRGVNVEETLELIGREIGWGVVERAPAPHLRRGKGIATMIKETMTPSSSNVCIRLEQHGEVTVLCATPEIGAGQETTLSQIAAEAIGVPVDVVSLPATDTAVAPFNGPVASSRTTFHVGNAIRRAGLELRARVLAMAGEVLGVEPRRLELQDGVISERDEGPRMTLSELLGRYEAGDARCSPRPGTAVPAHILQA
jgi:CO/xanthine dehydrogenase Mo-binding subunit